MRRMFRGLDVSLRLLRSWWAKAWARLKYEGIEFGSRVFLDSHVRLKATDGGKIVVEANTSLGRGVTMSAKEGLIRVGSGTFIGEGSMIVSGIEVNIGRNCLIAEHVTIRDQNHGLGDRTRPIKDQELERAAVFLEDDVWIGAKATITSGVRIGTGAVVGANAVVTKDIDAYGIAVGVPAKVVRSR